MKVFLSWSGDHSRAVALALHDWLPGVIHGVEPFVSAIDIYGGSRWQTDIAAELDETNFGVVCVTRGNQAEPWLNFEAGAIAKAVQSSRVIPLAIDLKPSDVELPLGQFQALPATESGISEMLISINATLDPGMGDDLLTRSFQKWWPDLEAALAKIEDEHSGIGPRSEEPDRSEREILEEVLNAVRGMARGVPTPEPSTTLSRAGMARLEALIRGSLRASGHKNFTMTLDASTISIASETEVAEGLRHEIEDWAHIYGAKVMFF